MTNIKKHSTTLWLGFCMVVALIAAPGAANAQAVATCGEFGSGCEQFLTDATNDGSTEVSSSMLLGFNKVCVGNVADAVTATLAIDHTWIGDLVVTLTSPASPSAVTLLGRLDNERMSTVIGGCDSDIAQASFADDGVEQSCIFIQRQSTPNLLPASGTMSDLLAGSITGTWQLSITDASVGNFGTLQDWSLQFDCDSIEDDRIFRDSFETTPP